MVDHDAAPEDAEVLGQHDRAGVRGAHRRVGRRREIEAEVHLLVDLLAVVEVRPVIGEARFDLRVGELPEGTAPEPPGSRPGGQGGDGAPVALPELPVDEQIELQQIGRGGGAVGRLAGQLRRLRHDRGHDAPQEAVAHRDPRAPEPPLEDPVGEVGGRFVAGRVPRVEPDRRAEILVMEEREERHPQVVPAFDPGSRGRVAGVLEAADADARFGVGGRHPVDDELRAAVRDVMQRRQRRQARRRQAYRDVGGDLAPALAQPEQHRPGRGDHDARRTLHQIGMGLAVEGARDAQAVVRLLFQRRAGGICEGEEQKDGAVLLDVRGERQEFRPGRLRRRDEGRATPDELAGPHDVEGRPGRLPRRNPGGDGGAQGQSGREPEDGANHPSMIPPLR